MPNLSTHSLTEEKAIKNERSFKLKNIQLFLRSVVTKAVGSNIQHDTSFYCYTPLNMHNYMVMTQQSTFLAKLAG